MQHRKPSPFRAIRRLCVLSSRPLIIVAVLLGFNTYAQAMVDADRLLSQSRARIDNINTQQLKELLEENPRTVLIDVRTRREIDRVGGTIDALENRVIPRGWLEFRIAESVPDRDTPIVVYCGTNIRSPLATVTLQEMGYTRVKNYADGALAWRDAGLPMEPSDLAPHSMLYQAPRQVAPGIWSAIGATAPPSYENSGHNNNLSFVITDAGVVVVNAGDNYLLAQELHREIRKITEQPVKYVVLENGQGHAMLGANYWREQGARIIAHEQTKEVIAKHGQESLEAMLRGRRDKGAGSRVILPDQTFSDRLVLDLGGRRIELLHLGPAHSPGDIQVWLPDEKLVIAGDIAFHERLLPVFEHTDTAAWLETWEKFAALDAQIVIPGHGSPTDMAEVTKYTRDYLLYMRGKIGALIEEGGDLQMAYAIDQSPYAHLDTFKELSRLNADRIFRAMEFE